MFHNPWKRASGTAAAASLRGNAHVTPTRVTGWVFDPETCAQGMQVRLTLGGKVLVEESADLPRPDVDRAFQTEGHRGFRIAIQGLSPQDLAQVQVEARASADREWQPIRTQAGGRRRQYQTFNDAKGGSKSAAKLRALRLGKLRNRHSEATPLKGLSVLDLGCNEGFFCGEALRQGARRVVGIDSSAHFLDGARRRFPKATFIQGSWWDLPNEKFDVILFLSAIHYEARQRVLLEKLANHLTPSGVLIIECGIANTEVKAWEAVRRADGVVRRYPSVSMFYQELLKPYSPRLVGPSVMQQGDPVPRHVFHCYLKESTALLVLGPTNLGKSTLALGLGERNIPLLRTDRLLRSMERNARYDWSPVAKVVRRLADRNLGDIGTAVAAECAGEFADLVMLEGPLEADLFCIEGEILRHEAVADELIRRLRERHIRAWVITPAAAGGESVPG